MKKFIKKTIAGLIAGVMAVSSMPFAALTAQAADSTEKTYVKSNIESFTGYTGGGKYTYNGTDLSKSDSAYYSNVLYDDGGFNDSTTQGNNDNMHGKLYINNNTVLMYDGTKDTILPVVVRAWPTSKFAAAKIYFSGISIDDATTASSWEFKENWLGGAQTYNEWPTGTASYPSSNVSYGSGMALDSNVNYVFKNKLYYKGATSTSKYYEIFNNSIKFKVKNYWGNKNSLDVDVISSTSNVYVVNYKPIAEKIGAMKEVYADIKANGEERYDEADLNAFYQAAYKVMSLNPNSYKYSTGVAAAVQAAGDDIADVVNNYLTTATTKLTKVVKLDTSAYDAALKEAEAKALNPNNRYTADSINALKAVIDSVKIDRENVKNQAQLNALVTKLQEANNSVVQAKFNVVFVTVGLDSTTENEKFNDYIEYGKTYNADAGANVKKWVVTTDNGNTSTVIDNFDQKASFVITKDAKIYAYLSGEDSSKTSSKVTFLGRHNQVVAIRYVAEGKTLETKDVDAPSIPFYKFENWDVASVKGDGNGNEYTVKASYTCKQTSEFCTVHFGDWSQVYAYDSYVYLPNTVAGTKYALYSDKECTKLLTVLDGVDFYAPKTSNIYVKAYDTEATVSIAVTGSFAEKDVEAGKNYANFNCKFYLPDGTDAIEWGVEVLSPDGTRTAKVKAEKLSERNEYTVRFGTEIGSKVTSIKGRAYLVYVQDGVKKTIYSSDEYVTVNLNA